MARDCRQHAVRQLNPAHCCDLNPLKHRGGPRRLGALGVVRAEPAGRSRGTLPDLAQPVDSALIERDRRITGVAAVRRSDLLVTAIDARFLT